MLRRRSLRRGRVSIAEGRVTLRSHRVPVAVAAVATAANHALRASTIKVAGTTFHVDLATLQAFKEGAVYRFYYLKNAPIHVLLSAEAVGSA